MVFLTKNAILRHSGYGMVTWTKHFHTYPYDLQEKKMHK